MKLSGLNAVSWLEALPNVVSVLPAAQQRCPHANACLTCFHFRTDDRFLEQHEKQLSETKKIMPHKRNTEGLRKCLEMKKQAG